MNIWHLHVFTVTSLTCVVICIALARAHSNAAIFFMNKENFLTDSIIIIIIIHKIYKAPNPLDNQMLKAQLVQKMKYMINIYKSPIGKVQT